MRALTGALHMDMSIELWLLLQAVGTAVVYGQVGTHEVDPCRVLTTPPRYYESTDNFASLSGSRTAPTPWRAS